MIILFLECTCDILGRDAIRQDIVGGLDIEGFFDFGVRGKDEMKEDQRRE